MQSYKNMLPLRKLRDNMNKSILAAVLTVAACAPLCAQEYTATWLVDGAKEKEQYRSHVSLECLKSSSSVVYATNGTDLILTAMRLNKTSGAPGNDYRTTGNNAAVLADAGSKILMEMCDVNSHTAQADGITATGSGTVITVREGSVSATRSESAGMTAINDGVIAVSGTTVNTFSNQCPSYYAANGGTVAVKDGKGENKGQASPLFYAASKGTITADKCRMFANSWAIATIDDGQLTLTANELTANSVSGFLMHGVGNSNSGNARLILEKNTVSVTDGPLFLVTNTNADISVNSNKLSISSHELMSVRADDWGVKGQNGGHAVLHVANQSLQGNITVDSISSLTLDLGKGGKLTGSINNVENREAQVRVVLGAGSSWTVKSDCYISSIEFAQPVDKALKQIKGKFNVYYNPQDPANAPLEGKEYKTSGGKLLPWK